MRGIEKGEKDIAVKERERGKRKERIIHLKFSLNSWKEREEQVRNECNSNPRFKL